jgi:hypothetical protein
MSEPSASGPRRRRFWVNLGEATAVVAVTIAGLNYWDSHREHSKAAQTAQAEAKARETLVLKGRAQPDGRRIVLDAAGASQIIQSQRYIFPSAVLDHPVQVTASSPQIDLDWIAAGVTRFLDRRRAKSAGEALLPVAIVTTYVEDGQSHTDRSIYQVGYAWRPKLFGRAIRLQGLALEQRAVPGDLQARVNRQWADRSSGGGPT